MGLIIFITTFLALLIIFLPLLKKIKRKWVIMLAVFITDILVVQGSVYQTCKDSWPSSSIGERGACSWHGGVVSRITDKGAVVLALSLVVIFIFLIYIFFRKPKENKQTRSCINCRHYKEIKNYEELSEIGRLGKFPCNIYEKTKDYWFNKGSRNLYIKNCPYWEEKK